MAWTATLQSISDQPFPDGTKSLTVNFVRGPGGSPDVRPVRFARTYKIAPGSWVNQTAILNYIAAEVQKLEGVEDIATAISTLLGQQVDPTTGGLKSSATIITNAQLRIALLGVGQYTAVDNWVTNNGSNRDKIAWATSPYFTIDSPFLNNVRQGLGFTQAQLANFFVNAFTILV